MKYFRMSYEEVVYKRSYINLILLNAAIPGMKPIEEKNEKVDKQSQRKRNYRIDDNGNSFLSSLI